MARTKQTVRRSSLPKDHPLYRPEAGEAHPPAGKHPPKSLNAYQINLLKEGAKKKKKSINNPRDYKEITKVRKTIKKESPKKKKKTPCPDGGVKVKSYCRKAPTKKK